MLALERVEFLVVIDPRRQRVLEALLARPARPAPPRARSASGGARHPGDARWSTERRCPGTAALPPGGLAIELVAFEENGLPELVDQAREPERDRIGVRPASGIVTFDEPPAELRDRLAERLVAISANELVVLARIRFGQEGVPHRHLAGIGQAQPQAGVDDGEQPGERVVSRRVEFRRDDLRVFLGDFAQRCQQQRFLAAKMKIDGRGRVPGHGGDLGRRDLGQSVTRDGRDRRIDEIEPGAAGTQGRVFEVGRHGANSKRHEGQNSTIV